MFLTIGLVILALGFWGCIAVIASHYGIDMYPASPWLTAALYYVGPWIALIGGFLLWKQARTWRRLHHLRHRPEPLARDPYRRPPPPDRPDALERTAKLCMTVAATALVYWFKLPGAVLILTAGLLVWAFKALAVAAVKRNSR